MSKALVAFDYASLDKDTKGKLVALAGQVRRHGDTFRKCGLEIGEAIHEAHELLSGAGREGQFTPWVESETDIGISTAYNLLNVFRRAKKFPILETLPPTVAYMLAPDKVPDAAIKEVEKAVGKGQRPTVEFAKSVLDKFRTAVTRSKATPPATAAPPVATPPVSDDPIGDACVHEWDDDACRICFAPKPAEPWQPPEGVKKYNDTSEPTTADESLDLAAKQKPYDEMLNYLTQAKKLWNEIVADERDGVYAVSKRQRVLTLFNDIYTPIAQARPMKQCDHCDGKGCKKCSGCGWWPRSVVEGLSK